MLENPQTREHLLCRSSVVAGASIPIAEEQTQLWSAARMLMGLLGHLECRAEWNRAGFCLLKTNPSLPSRQLSSCCGLWHLLLCCLLQQERWMLLFVLRLHKSLQQRAVLCLWFNSRGNCCWGHDKGWSSPPYTEECWGFTSSFV